MEVKAYALTSIFINLLFRRKTDTLLTSGPINYDRWKLKAFKTISLTTFREFSIPGYVVMLTFNTINILSASH